MYFRKFTAFSEKFSEQGFLDNRFWKVDVDSNFNFEDKLLGKLFESPFSYRYRIGGANRPLPRNEGVEELHGDPRIENRATPQ